jgi:hypothetical protein
MRVLALVLVLVLVCCRPAAAAEWFPPQWASASWASIPRLRAPRSARDAPNCAEPAPTCTADGASSGSCGCPNDYRHKPSPFIPPVSCKSCPNDYAHKPSPFIPPAGCQSCANDYDRKPPVKIRSNCVPWYQCVPECPINAAPVEPETTAKAKP